MSGLPLVWGASPDEAARPYPADALVPGPTLRMTRAVTVEAAPDAVWPWLCQLAVAPYSYDWIDNLGRRSPRTLTPGADHLVVGQPMVMVFDLTDVDAPHQWTGLTRPATWRAFGPIGVTYAVEPDPGDVADPRRARLVCRMVARSGSRSAHVRGHLLAWGDLVMMRRQLLTLKSCAESAHR